MATIQDFVGISVKVPLVASLVDSSLGVVKNLQLSMRVLSETQLHAGTSRLALIAAMSASTALLAMASATCTLDTTPADIGVTVDSAGNLILRCGHSPPHEWDYSTGQKI